MSVRPPFPVDKEKSLAEMPVPLEVLLGVSFGEKPQSQLTQNRDIAHPMKEDVKEKRFSPPL